MQVCRGQAPEGAVLAVRATSRAVRHSPGNQRRPAVYWSTRDRHGGEPLATPTRHLHAVALRCVAGDRQHKVCSRLLHLLFISFFIFIQRDRQSLSCYHTCVAFILRLFLLHINKLFVYNVFFKHPFVHPGGATVLSSVLPSCRLTLRRR